MVQKVFKTGNSLAVTIPARFVMSAQVRPGDTVRVKAEASRARIIYQFSATRQLAFDEELFPKRNKKQ